MIRTCKGDEERWTQTARSATVKSKRANYGEENESGDESDGRDSSDDAMESNACAGRTNFMTDFYHRPTAILTAAVIKTRMVVSLLRKSKNFRFRGKPKRTAKYLERYKKIKNLADDVERESRIICVISYR